MGLDLIKKALSAKRESKHVEFKQSFDPNSAEEWCEIVKDLVAIANSGGGIIVFGLDSLGIPTGISVSAVAQVDPADIANKIGKYTGPVDLEFEIRELKKAAIPWSLFLSSPFQSRLSFKDPVHLRSCPENKKLHSALARFIFDMGRKANLEPVTTFEK
jgi:predicted HTH transcriptional regulator